MVAAETSVARRCCLSAPGIDAGKLGKALTSGADEIVVDLEDSVPPASKSAARRVVADWLQAVPEDGPTIAVRINAPGTPWCHDDIATCVTAEGPRRSIVVPKVESAGDLHFVDRLLAGHEAIAGRSHRITVQALVESALGLANLAEIVSATTRLRAVVLGYADLGVSLGRRGDPSPDVWLPAQHQVLVAARSAGVAAIDGPALGVLADAAFLAAVDRSAGLGFDGKWVIHPRQVASVTRAFTPDRAEITHARRVLKVLAEAHERGAGAVALDGTMIDEAVAAAARRTLARAGDGAGA